MENNIGALLLMTEHFCMNSIKTSGMSKHQKQPKTTQNNPHLNIFFVEYRNAELSDTADNYILKSL